MNIAASKDLFVRKSTFGEDSHQHWDVLLKNDCKVDVKAMKRIQRADESVQDEWTWVELHGVRPHDRGWLYGQSKIIAFETNDSFLLVKREDLISLVHKYVNFDTKVNYAREAKYKVYQRKGRADEITMIETEKLKEILYKEWKKDLTL